MDNVGVTYVGARAQIEKQLRDRPDIDRDMLWEASSYIARSVSDHNLDLTYRSQLKAYELFRL